MATNKQPELNAKTLVTTLLSMLKSAEALTSDENLLSRVKYALDKYEKDPSKIRKSDLLELAKEVRDSDQIPELTGKPKSTGKTAKTDDKPAAKPESKGKPKLSAKSANKSGKSKDKPDAKPAVETSEPLNTKGADNQPFALIFPAEIEHPDLGKLVSCKGQYETYEEVRKALEGGKTLFFACYWTKRQIKEFGYAETRQVDVPKDGFLFDLDLAQAVLFLEQRERLYALSVYTEALYRFEGEDFKPVTDKDPRSGKEFSVRLSEGLEFEIYAPSEETKG